MPKNTYIKGLTLERIVAELFRKFNYEVQHNVKLIGRSGVAHQIDVLVKYRTPLYTSLVVVECKHYDKPVNKDVIMKVSEIVQDVGADRGIIVTTSYFTEDAIQTAHKRNIDLWDRAKLEELLNRAGLSLKGRPYAPPERQEVKEMPKKLYILPPKDPDYYRSKLLDHIKGNVEFSYYAWYPLIELTLESPRSRGIIRRYTVIEKVNVIIDIILGRICGLHKGIVCDETTLNFWLRDDEIYFLKKLAKIKYSTLDGISSATGLSNYQTRKILSGLKTKGFVKVFTSRRRKIYRLYKVNLYFKSSISEKFEITHHIEGKWEKGVDLSILLEGNLKNLIKNAINVTPIIIGGTLKNVSLIMYPLYIIGYIEKNTKHLLIYDIMRDKVDKLRSSELVQRYDVLAHLSPKRL